MNKKIRRRAKKYFFAICLNVLSLFLSQSSSLSYAGNIVAIVNKDNPVSSLAVKDLENLYKGKKKQWVGGQEVVLFLPPSKSEAMKTLASKVFKKGSALAVSKFYLKAVFQQKFAAPPQSVSGAEDAAETVAGEPGGIALVDSSEITDKSSIKIIKIDGL